MKAKLIFSLLLLASAIGAKAQTKYFVTCGGGNTGTVAYSLYPDPTIPIAPVTATLAALGAAAGTAADQNGNIYFTDPTHNVICEIEQSTGNLFYIAGIPGTSGDGATTTPSSPATNCALKMPYAITYNQWDHKIYFTDTGTHRVCALTQTSPGTFSIESIVGNGMPTPSGVLPGVHEPVSYATLHSPKGIAVDIFGKLYISDGGNSLVRGINLNLPPASREIEIYAGNTGTSVSQYVTGTTPPNSQTVSLNNQIEGLALDVLNNLYIADKMNHRVLRVDGSITGGYLYALGAIGSGVISTVAGTELLGSTPYAPNSSATGTALDNPYTLAVDMHYNLYIGNLNGIVVVNTIGPSGISNFAGDPLGTASLTTSNCAISSGMGYTTTGTPQPGPIGLCFVLNGGRNELIFADNTSNAIRRLEFPNIPGIYNCANYAPLEYLSVEGGSLGSSVNYQFLPYATGGSSGPITSLGTFSSSITAISTHVLGVAITGGAADAYDVILTDPACISTPFNLGPIAVQHTNGPTPYYITCGSDIATASSLVLMEQSDNCNCGINIFTNGTEARATYYVESSTTSYPGYYTGLCGAGTYMGASGIYAPQINGTTSSQTFTVVAERDGCHATMLGSVLLDDSLYAATHSVARVTSPNLVLTPCNPTITLSVSHPTPGKTYNLTNGAGPISTITASSTSTITFPPISLPGHYYVYEGWGFASRILCGNTDVTTRKIDVNMSAPMTVSGDKVYTLCTGSTNMELDVAVTDIPASSLTYSYHMTGPGSYNVTNTTGIFTMPSPVPGTYTATITPSVGLACAVSTSIIASPTTGCSPCDYFIAHSPVSGISCSNLITCTNCNDLQPFHTVNATFAVRNNFPLATNPVKNIWLANGMTLNDTISFSDNVILTAENSGITIGSTAVISFNHSHIFSSTWNGFSVASNATHVGQLSLVNNTLVEKVSNGLAVSYLGNATSFIPSDYNTLSGLNCIVNSDGLILNKNKYDMGFTCLQAFNTNIFELPFHVVNTVFTSRDFECFPLANASTPPSVATDFYPFKWPDISDLKTIADALNPYNPYNPKYLTSPSGANGLDMYPASTTQHLRAFALSNHAKVGSDYYYYAIGDRYTPSKSNLIDNLTGVLATSAGIWCYNSPASFSLYNTVFRKIENDAKGIYFKNPTAGAQFRFTLGGDGTTSLNCGNKFYSKWPITLIGADCDISIKQTQMYDTVPLTNTNWGSGPVAIAASPSNASFVDIANNYFANFQTGLNFRTAGTPIVTINSNVFEDYVGAKTDLRSSPIPTPPSPYTQFLRTAITVAGDNIASLSITNDTITNAAFGINVTSATNVPVNIQNNDIILRYYTNETVSPNATLTSAFPYFGIGVNAVASTGGRLTITQNRIKGDGWFSHSYILPNNVNNIGSMMGVRILGSGNDAKYDSISCNVVSDINMGFVFGSTSHIHWKHNSMLRNSYGLVYIASFNPDPSMNSCSLPDDNTWDDAGGTTNSTWLAWPNWAITTSSFTSSANPAMSPFHTFSYANPTTSPINYYRSLMTSVVPWHNGAFSASLVYKTAAIGGSIFDYSSGCTPPSYDPSCIPVAAKPAGNAITTVTTEDAAQTYTLFPNPNTGNITISQHDVVDGTTEVRVMNAVGSSVYESRLDFFGGQAQLSLPDVASGIYIVELRDTHNHRFVTKMVVTK